MKVNDVDRLQPTRELGSSERAEKAKDSGTVDRVSTAESQRIEAAVEKSRSQSGAERAAQLRELAEQVKKGQYTPNPQRIADRIMESAELAARLRSLL